MEINVNLMRTRADRWRSSKFVAVLAVWTAATAAGLSLVPATAAQAAVPGGVQAWGLNTSGGQLCNGGAANSSTPVAAAAPANANVTAISAGAFHSLAVISGAVFGCGVNRFGQLGNGTTVNSLSPVAAAAPANANIVAVSAGWDHSLALSTTGTVYAWGNDRWGQLGNNATPTAVAAPAIVAFPVGTPAMTAIAAGAYFSLSLDNTGQVWSWGYNLEGELGQPAAGFCILAPLTPCSATPVKVAAPANAGVTAIAAGADHGLAIIGGAVFSWGLNNYGQLGVAGNPPGCGANCPNSATPVAAAAPANAGVTAIAAGGMHSLAIIGGAVWGWGRNNQGQLGNGNAPTGTAVPVAALAPANANVSAIAAGWQHSLALTSTGGVLAWGWNASGQLGDGTLTNQNAPEALAAPFNAGVSLISAGYAHSVAVQ
jgi:alpha-tubulin suppressor-like RCC1 family protein